jgi:hypothetical protein
MQFKDGDEVEWTSQAGGKVKTKSGFIVEVIPPNAPPPQVRGSGPVGAPRKHESYVVGVLDKKGLVFYWPRVISLKLV